EAGTQQQRADANFRRAIEEIGQLLKSAEDDPTTGTTPQLEQVRNVQFDRALAFYRQLLQENRTDPVGRHLTGLVYTELIYAFTRRGEGAQAIEAYGQALAVFKQLVAEFPTETRYQADLARCHASLATAMHAYCTTRPIGELAAGRYEQAAGFYRQGITL